MAKYRITSPDGGTFEITAPDDASESDVMSYAQSQFAGQRKTDTSFIKEGGYQPEDVEQHYKAATLGGKPGVARRMLDAATLGTADEIMAGLGAPIDFAVDNLRGKNVSLSDAYSKNLEVQRRLRDDARKATEGYGLGVDLAGGLLAAPAGAVAGAVGAARSYGQLAAQGAKVGAPIGAVAAFADNDGDVGDRLAAAPAGAFFGGVGGAVLTPAIPAAADAVRRGAGAVSRMAQGMVGRTQQNVTAANTIADDLVAAGVPRNDLPGAAVAPDWQARTAESLAGSVAGGPIRSQVTRTNAHLENNLRGMLDTQGQDTGLLLQDVARRQTTTNRLPGIERMSDADLAHYSGLRPEPQVAPSGSNRVVPQVVEEANYLTTFKDKTDAGYELFGRMAPGMSHRVGRPTPATPTTAVRDLLEEFRQTTRSRGLAPNDDRQHSIFDSGNPGYGEIRQNLQGYMPREVVDTIYSNKPQTINNMKDMRREIREANPGQPGTRTPDERNLSRLEGAFTDDMHTMMRAKGRPDMSATMRLVDQEYARIRNEVTEPLVRQVFGDRVRPEQGLKAVMSSLNGGNNQLFNAVYQVARRGGQVDQVTRGLLHEMSSGGLPAFVSQWRSVPPPIRDRMFAYQNGAELRASLDRLDRVVQRLEPLNRAAARGRDGLNVMSAPNWLSAAGMWGGLPTFFATLGGQNAVARFMSSPRYVDWLTRAIQIPNQGSAEWRRHVARLSAISGSNDPFGREVVANAGELLRPQQPQEVRR